MVSDFEMHTAAASASQKEHNEALEDGVLDFGEVLLGLVLLLVLLVALD